MSLHACNVLGAPLVDWRPPKDEEGSLAFSHAKTGVTDIAKDGCAKGFTLWTGDLEGNPIFMAFDWVELRPGVPILTDPNAVLTNLSMLNDRNEREPRLMEVVHLTLMICGLRWQDAVLAAARDYRNQRKSPARMLHHMRGAVPAGDSGNALKAMRRAA